MAPSTTKLHQAVLPGMAPQVGDRVFVCLDATISRPMWVTAASQVLTGPTSSEHLEFRVSGVVLCEPSDHTTLGIRTVGSTPGDPARFHGRPDRLTPYVYAECLAEGNEIGQWRRAL